MNLVNRTASLALLAVLFYFPLAVIFAKGFSAASIQFVFSSAALGVMWFTIWQALVSALGATFIGLVFAYLLYRKYFFGQQLIRALVTVPFVLPVLVIAISFSTFQISNVIVAIVLSHVYLNAPIVARTVGSHWLSIDTQLEDAAALDGAGRLATFFRVTLFELRSTIVSSFVLAFAYSAAAFGTVLLLGHGSVNSIETAIYQQVFSYLDLSAATGLATTQVFLTVALFWLSNRFVRGQIGFGSSIGYSHSRIDARDLPLACVGLVLLLVWLLPIWNVFQIAIMHYSGFGIDDSMLIAFWHSIRNVTLVVLFSAAIGLWIGHLIQSEKRWFSNLLTIAYLAPITVSTVLVGLGFLISFGSFRSNWLVIPIAETVLALPLVVRLVSTALEALDVSLIEQARSDGASTWQQFRLIQLPLIRPSLNAALGFAGVIALGDFGASSFLSFGDQETLPIVLYRYFSHPGADNYAHAMALSAAFIVVAIVVVLATELRKSSRNELRSL